MACFICDATIPDLGSFQYWSITVAHEQNYLGKCIIALRRHEEDFLALRAEEREEMWQAASVVRDAITRCFAPDRFNYQVLGNSVPHVHMHLTPRYTSPREFAGTTFTDDHWGTWPFPAEENPPPAVVKAVALAIGEAMPKGDTK